MRAALPRPSSAEKLFETTRTSSTESAFGVRLLPLLYGEFVFEPSSEKVLDSLRWPFALVCGEVSPENESACAEEDPRNVPESPRPVTPGWKASRLNRFLPFIGSSFSLIGSILAEILPASVSTDVISPDT